MKSEQSIKVMFYGRLADLLESELDVLVSQECSIAELRDRIADQHPAAAALRNTRVRACVDDAMVPESHRIAPGTQVEFFPPVSGG
jgi:molybdopterin converting factor small subunit